MSATPPSICFRCKLRLSGVMLPPPYLSPPNGDDEAAAAESCSVCVGVLPLIGSQAFINKVRDRVAKMRFEGVRDFSLALALPATVPIREKAWREHEDEVAAAAATAAGVGAPAAPAAPRATTLVANLKMVARWLLDGRLSQALQLRLVNEGRFVVSLTMLPCDELEDELTSPDLRFLRALNPHINRKERHPTGNGGRAHKTGTRYERRKRARLEEAVAAAAAAAAAAATAGPVSATTTAGSSNGDEEMHEQHRERESRGGGDDDDDDNDDNDGQSSSDEDCGDSTGPLPLIHPLCITQCIATALRSGTPKQMRVAGLLPPHTPPEPARWHLVCHHENVHIAGRYLKLSREFSQSPWLGASGSTGADGDSGMPRGARSGGGGGGDDEDIAPGAIVRGSVEGVLNQVLLPAFRAASGVLISSGREDLDVRMLGAGRPFTLELASPHQCAVFTASRAEQQQLLAEIEARLNREHPEVQVRGLHVPTPDAVVRLKNSVREKVKSYRCVVWSRRAHTAAELAARLDHAGALQLEQRTPIRVVHRRAMCTRPRTIHRLTSVRLNAHWFQLDVVAEAGTYIKEFVHSDRGRTVPSVASLLDSECVIVQLDVIDLAWESTHATDGWADLRSGAPVTTTTAPTSGP